MLTGPDVDAPGPVGFGRSVESVRTADHSDTPRHVEWVRVLVSTCWTCVGSPWWPGLGRLLGLRLVAGHLDGSPAWVAGEHRVGW